MSKKVLVVDDDPDVRMFNSAVVEEVGCTPLEASNGDDGLKIVKKEKPDLVILDVMMPRKTGVRLYREMKTKKALKHIPIIIVSGIAKNAFIRSLKAMAEFGHGAAPEPDIYISKPAEPEQLAAAIHRMLQTEGKSHSD